VASVFSGPLDGVLGADSLSSFDVDLDLPGQRMVLYEKQTCQGAVPAWPERYATISAGRSVGDHLFFPVQLDGRRTDAFVDTGSQFTVLSTRAALAMGMTPGVLQHDRIATVLGAAAERPPSPGLVRLRGVEALEANGTPEARKVLAGLAAGQAGSPLAAEAALKRLGRRP